MPPPERRLGHDRLIPRRVEFLGAAGNRLVGDVFGDGSSKSVILLHGGGQTRHSWRRTALALADAGYRCLILDQRGHGDSEWTQRGYRLPELALDLALVADAFGARPVVIGASIGGLVGLVAAAAGATSRGVVLVDAAPLLANEGAERIRSFMARRRDGFASVEEAVEYVSRHLGSERRVEPASLARSLRRGLDGRYRWHWDPRFTDDAPWSRSAAGRELLLSSAAELHLPALLVRGQLSDVVDLDAVEEFRRLVPHAQFVDVAGANHMVAGDSNAIFTQAVIVFLAAIEWD